MRTGEADAGDRAKFPAYVGAGPEDERARRVAQIPHTIAASRPGNAYSAANLLEAGIPPMRHVKRCYFAAMQKR